MTLAHQPKRKMTYNDYCKLPDYPRMELIDGEFLMSPSPNFGHQDISGELFTRLREWVKQRGLGKVLCAPMDVVFSEYNVVQPDILFISNERSNVITEKNIQGAPDFLIEILSPWSTSRDQVVKKALYEKHGVSEYWIVDPKNQEITAMTLHGKIFRIEKVYAHPSDIVESSTLPGFRIKLADAFPA